MEEIISKELLSDILELPILEIRPNGSSVDIIHYKSVKQPSRWNIYELAHKCKAWAVINNYNFIILIDTIAICHKGVEMYTIYNNLNDDSFIPFDPICEIKACEWIYDKVNK